MTCNKGHNTGTKARNKSKAIVHQLLEKAGYPEREQARLIPTSADTRNDVFLLSQVPAGLGHRKQGASSVLGVTWYSGYLSFCLHFRLF